MSETRTTENDMSRVNEIGERLRAIRHQQGLSLQDVETRSDNEFKASVLGAYERGERTISVGRLVRLAELYDVPADQLLPRDITPVDIDLTKQRDARGEGVTLDLVRLEQLEHPDAQVLARYAATIQVQRQDYNGRMLTIRGSDVRVLAAVLGKRPGDLPRHLDELGLSVRR
jgi:transcriptional regulator with XRE-family HTH domain